MDNDSAKLILQAYRPNGADAGDPFFEEALKQARLDPDLGQWFAAQQAFDLRIGDAINAIVVPPGLREAIIRTQKIARPLNSRLFNSGRRQAVLALAACLVMLLIATGLVAIVHFQRTSETPTLGEMTEKVLDLKRHDQISLGTMNTDPEKLRAWLAVRGAPSTFVIPRGLIGVPALGCQSYRIENVKVSLICFTLAPGHIVHLFIIDRGAIADAPVSLRPQVHRESNVPYAAWSQEGQSYILTGNQISADDLDKLIETI
jgi:hypothetical protein